MHESDYKFLELIPGIENTDTDNQQLVNNDVEGPVGQADGAVNSEDIRRKHEREERQRLAKLPVFDAKSEFIVRLREERLLILTAETGSGKTTQLCQYAADAFDGHVVCTQPR
jgi:HrpA-like RNA helicase